MMVNPMMNGHLQGPMPVSGQVAAPVMLAPSQQQVCWPICHHLLLRNILLEIVLVLVICNILAYRTIGLLRARSPIAEFVRFMELSI